SSRPQRSLELGRLRHETDALAAATTRRLDQKREADALRRRPRFVEVDAVRRAGHRGDAGAVGDDPGLHLVTKLAQRIRSRADERDARSCTGARELSALGEEAVTGMNGVGAAL